MGDREIRAPALVESMVKYHPVNIWTLTFDHKLENGPCQAGSLTGAVASKRVTEAPKGSLRQNGNLSESVKAKGSLTERPTRRPDTKVGLSDPTVQSGMAVAYRTKATPGITGW